MVASDVKEEVSHVVEIPAVDEEQCGQKKLPLTMTATAIQHHPMTEISQSPGHLLLLQLWQREENLFNCRIGLKETWLDSIKNKIFHLCCFVLIFHGIFLTLVYASSPQRPAQARHVRKWWVPAVVMLCTCFVFVVLVQVKVCRYWKAWRQLQRENCDIRALARCIQELRIKGASFNLSKEPIIGKRMKSSSVEIKWKPITLCSQNAVAILLCFTGLVCPATEFILCVH